MRKRKHKFAYSLHYSFIVLMVCSALVGLLDLMLLYFACLVCHELAHAYVARKKGYQIGKIKLMATGAVLEAESDEFTFTDEVLIALAGPLFNLLLCLIVVVFWWIKPEVYNYTQDLCVVNLAIFCFNMLPIFPLDGGRILLGILSRKTERAQAVRIVKTISVILSCLLFIVFLISLFSSPQFSLGVMAITLFAGAISTDKDASYKRIYLQKRKLERVKKQGLEQRVLYVGKDIEYKSLIKLIDLRHYTTFMLVDDKMQVVSKLSEDQIIEKVLNVEK